MTETINVRTLDIRGNYILVKLDPDYNFREIMTPQGKVVIELVDFTTSKVQNQAITGMVMRTPAEVTFHRDLLYHERGVTISSEEWASKMRSSMPHDRPLQVEIGDRIVFDYKVAMDAPSEGRVLKDETGELLMLMRYEVVFAKIHPTGDYIPVNGWVFVRRDQMETREDRPELTIIRKEDRYASPFATVVASDYGIVEYLDKGTWEPQVSLPPGRRVVLRKNFGYRIAYDVHAGDLLGVEAVRRRSILAIFE